MRFALAAAGTARAGTVTINTVTDENDHSCADGDCSARDAIQTEIEWVTARGPAYGKADVYVDGVKQGSYNLYSAAPEWKVAYAFSGLSAGQHTIEIRVLGQKDAASTGKTVIVDGFQGPIAVP